MESQGWRLSFRKHLAPVGQLRGVDGAAHPLHALDVILRKHIFHVGDLLNANPVLTCDRPAKPYAETEDFPGQLFCLLKLPFYTAIVEDQGVQVPITCVKHISYPQTMTCCQLPDFPQRRPQAATGNNSILDNKIGAQPPRR